MSHLRKRDTLVFVCTANICRSPMAAALVGHALSAETAPLKDLRVASAGVSSYAGEPVSPDSVKALHRVGIEIRQHRSRSLDQELVDRALAIFGMTESHRTLVTAGFELDHPHLYLMREFMDVDDIEIADPYGLDFRAYEDARDSMVEAVPSLLAAVRRIIENPGQPLARLP